MFDYVHSSWETVIQNLYYLDEGGRWGRPVSITFNSISGAISRLTEEFAGIRIINTACTAPEAARPCMWS